MRKYLAAFLIYVLYLVPLPIAAQTKKGSPAKPQTTVSKKETVVQTGVKTYLEPTAKFKIFTAAWNDGKLPAPLELPADETKYSENELLAKTQRTLVVDQNVQLLVDMTTAENEKSSAAIVAAILEAGFAIEKSDGTRLKTSGAQGISIPEWQIAGAMKLYGQETEFGLDVFSNALKQTFPQLKTADVGRLLLEDLREDLESDIPAKRFWARYIAGLGKNRVNPYDLTNPGINLKQVRIDPLQNLLILNRLAGDLSTVDKKIRALYETSDQNLYQSVSYSLRRSNFYSLSPNEFFDDDDDKGGCSIESNTSILFDYAAIGNGAGFGKVVESFIKSLEDMGETARATRIGNIVKGFGYANIVLNLAKFLITLASVEVKISLDGDSLSRTKTKIAGERKQLKAELKTDTGKWLQMVNCVRPLLNLIGLDASVPTNGAMSNVKVTWVLLDEDDSLNAALHNLNLDGVPTSGNDQNSAPINGVYLAGTADNFTDQDGIARIEVVGQPQERDMSREKLTQKTNNVRVATYFQTKTSDPKSATEVVSTIGDFLGPTVSLLLGDKIGGVAGLALEAAYRATWCPSKPFSFTVKDWVPCQDGWEGTITKRTEYSNTSAEKNADGTNTVTEKITKNISVKLEVGKLQTVSGTVFLDSSAEKKDETNLLALCYYDGLGGTNPVKKETFRKSIETRLIIGAANVSGTIDFQENTFSLSLKADKSIFGNLTFEAGSTDGCNPRGNFSRRRSEKISDSPSIQVSGEYNPNDPYVLKGGKTVKDGDFQTTYAWDLRKCH